jgi:hypothetical protein
VTFEVCRRCGSAAPTVNVAATALAEVVEHKDRRCTSTPSLVSRSVLCVRCRVGSFGEDSLDAVVAREEAEKGNAAVAARGRTDGRRAETGMWQLYWEQKRWSKAGDRFDQDLKRPVRQRLDLEVVRGGHEVVRQRDGCMDVDGVAAYSARPHILNDLHHNNNNITAIPY